MSQTLLKFMSIESVMLSDHLILCYPLFLLPSIFLSIRVFSNQSAFWNRWPKYWSFSPSNEYSGLISFRIDWFDLLAVWGNLKSLLQHHNLKASILWCSTFFMVQLLHLYMTQQTKLFFLHSLASCTSDFGSFPAQSEENSLTLSKTSRSTLG